MKKPLVSVIIPIYNRLELLQKTLLSLKKQTYTNFEVIIIDDCSDTEFDLQSFNDYFDTKTTYQRLNKNSGPGKARSYGRQLAKGEFVAYLDSDDEWKEEFLMETVKALIKYKEVSMVFTNTLIRAGEKNRIRNNMGTGLKDFFHLIINEKIYWATGAVLWRANISLENNWSKYRDHEDYFHDILSLYNNPTIYYLQDNLCIVNKNQALGVKRSNSQMCLVLISILKTYLKRKPVNKYDLIKFTLSRLKKRKYSVSDFYYFFIISSVFAQKLYFEESLYVYKLYLKRVR
jgi:glycosyltransferase involved in cell wall biosynthesis